MLQGGDVPPHRVGELPDSVVYLKPELDRATESRALRMMEAAQDELEQWYETYRTSLKDRS